MRGVSPRLTFPRGFTLTELAIVLFIVALLIGSMMLPITAQVDTRDYAEVQKTLGEIRDALTGFATSHSAADGKPYLPCPDTNDDGTENRTGNACTADEGRVPWVTLGLGQLDPWTNRYRYRVTPAFANSGTGFLLTTAGTMTVCATSACVSTVATAVPAVILTQGKNGAGAFNDSGGTNAASANANELENSDGDTTFVNKEADPNYDDVVIWLAPSILFNRMVAAGKLP